MLRDLSGAKDRIRHLLDHAEPPQSGDLRNVIDAFAPMVPKLQAMASQQPTPFYAFDQAGFAQALRRFSALFDAQLAPHQAYYAVKSNHHPWLLETAAAEGYGLDVSSAEEMTAALQLPAVPIVFSGPAKSAGDHQLAIAHRERVTVHLDSFGELARLGALLQARYTGPDGQPTCQLRCGVRVHTGVHGAWSKFGIPLDELPEFLNQAAAFPHLAVCGLQAHLSWNRTPEPYVQVLALIGKMLREGLTGPQRAQMAFIDIGGGYKPHGLEGFFPKDDPLASILHTANEAFGVTSEFLEPYYPKPSTPLAEYAQAIGGAFAREIRSVVPAVAYTEPGRIVSTYAMHIVLRVVDKKTKDLVIVDGGVNLVGWEKYLAIYAPVLNLTRPSLREFPVKIGGSLCDAEDIWGGHCYGDGIELGDVLVVPFQGAYAWGLAQQFIRPIAPVRRMP